MIRLVWKEELATGQNLIDNQLKRLLMLCQDCLDAHVQGLVHVDELLPFMAYQFATQEKLMRVLEVPAAKIMHHKAAHQRLLTRFRTVLEGEFSNRMRGDLEHTFTELIEHIRWIDKQAQSRSLGPADFR